MNMINRYDDDERPERDENVIGKYPCDENGICKYCKLKRPSELYLMAKREYCAYCVVSYDNMKYYRYRLYYKKFYTR